LNGYRAIAGHAAGLGIEVGAWGVTHLSETSRRVLEAI
jgi:hypothetical protein